MGCEWVWWVSPRVLGRGGVVVDAKDGWLGRARACGQNRGGRAVRGTGVGVAVGELCRRRARGPDGRGVGIGWVASGQVTVVGSYTGGPS